LTFDHSTTSKGETSVLSRAFLEHCLEERLCQEDPILLDSRSREFLELVAYLAATTFSDEIVVPKELLEAFFAENQ
jgi:hypothetical protein